jgi:hypothetical protein
MTPTTPIVLPLEPDDILRAQHIQRLLDQPALRREILRLHDEHAEKHPKNPCHWDVAIRAVLRRYCDARALDLLYVTDAATDWTRLLHPEAVVGEPFLFFHPPLRDEPSCAAEVKVSLLAGGRAVDTDPRSSRFGTFALWVSTTKEEFLAQTAEVASAFWKGVIEPWQLSQRRNRRRRRPDAAGRHIDWLVRTQLGETYARISVSSGEGDEKQHREDTTIRNSVTKMAKRIGARLP